MAKVTLKDGSTFECTGDVEQIYDQIRDAQGKTPPGLFIKCGGKYIAIDQIKVIGRPDVAPGEDDDGETGWPGFKITIEGVQGMLRVKD